MSKPSSRMQILYFHQHFSTPLGAGGLRSYQFARRLVAAGHDVTMVCGSYDGVHTGLESAFSGGRRQGIVDGIKVVELDLPVSNSDGFLKRSVAFLKFAAAGIRYALASRYDVLFATSTPLTAGLPGIAARWLRGKRFIFEVRDLWPELPRDMGVITNPIVLGAMSVLEWVSYNSSIRRVGLSPGIVQGVERRSVTRDRTLLIPNGCDLEIFDRSRLTPWRPGGVAPSDLLGDIRRGAWTGKRTGCGPGCGGGIEASPAS